MAAFRGIALVAAAGAWLASAVEIVAHLRHRNLAKLEEVFWSVSDPDHANYLRFLSLPEIASIIGATDEHIQQAQEWLVGLGAEVSSIRVSSLRDTVTATLPPSYQVEAEVTTGWFKAVSAARPAPVEFIVSRWVGEVGGKSQRARRAAAEPRSEKTYSVSAIKAAYGMPVDLQASNPATTQMVWGPGTFGYSRQDLEVFKSQECPLLNTSRVSFDTEYHGTPGGDNWGEGELDVTMIASFGLNVETVASNTNTSTTTEEGQGFGQALLDFATQLAAREHVPHVLSISLGSLSALSCDLLCDEAAKRGHPRDACNDYLQKQRQVCMFLSQDQVARISTALQVLGTRGVTVFGSSGDGGSHFSFGRFEGGSMASVLNEISCQYQIPVFPTGSPYVVSVGGEMWRRGDPSHPVTWAMGSDAGSGGGFSWQFRGPAYQRAAVDAYLTGPGMPPRSSFNATGRAYPDIAAVGNEGTSQSSPIVAGMFSMVVDHRLNAGLPPLGFVAPRIWKVAQDFPGEAFGDITEGNSKTSCDNGFPATTGWDPNTGWGRPVWPGMLKHFGSDEALRPRGPSLVFA